MTFNELHLNEKTKKALQDIGYNTPTPIQEKAIPIILEGKDLIGQSKTGTGKTASYSLPIIEKIETSNKKVQAIVLCPTRELALQVAEEVRKFLKYQEGIKTLAIYGGQSIETISFFFYNFGMFFSYISPMPRFVSNSCYVLLVLWIT